MVSPKRSIKLGLFLIPSSLNSWGSEVMVFHQHFQLPLNYMHKFWLGLAATAMTTIVGATAIVPTAVADSNDDANFQEEVRNNTLCSFIITKEVGSMVRVRKEPNTKSTVVATLKRGDGVRAVNRRGNWVRIAALTAGAAPRETFIPLQGWVFNQYVNGCSEDQFDRWRK
jgi:Bacterial SH3 domain